MRVLEGTVEFDGLDAFVETLGEVGERHDCAIQAFDARYVVGRRHLERAVDLADRAIGRGENVAHDRAVEILLYAAGRRQIDRALELGVDDGGGPVVILVDGNDEGDAEVDAVAELEETLSIAPAKTLSSFDEDRVRAFFEISDVELAATDASIEDLVCERVALLEVEK